MNRSKILVPLGGVVLVVAGIEGAFLLSAGLYLLALGATLAVTARTAPSGHGTPVWASMREGFAAVRADRRLAAILAVTVCAPALNLMAESCSAAVSTSTR